MSFLYNVRASLSYFINYIIYLIYLLNFLGLQIHFKSNNWTHLSGFRSSKKPKDVKNRDVRSYLDLSFFVQQ